jgi:hypothetical protein
MDNKIVAQYNQVPPDSNSQIWNQEIKISTNLMGLVGIGGVLGLPKKLPSKAW